MVSLRRCCIRTSPFTAKLKTGNAMVNKLWSNILWGQRSNFVGLPTDCPQRDERLGWAADAQVFWRAASYNAALASFTRKFAGDLRGTQVGTPYYGIYAPGTARISPGVAAAWSDAGVIIPWTSWLQTGDTSVIDQNWAGDAEVCGRDRRAESGWDLAQRFGNSVWRLAVARRAHAGGSGGYGVLGIRREHAARDGACDGTH